MLNHTEVQNPLMAVELEEGLPLPGNSLILATHQRQASECLTGDLEIKIPTRSDIPWFQDPFSSTMSWTKCAQVQELSLLQ